MRFIIRTKGDGYGNSIKAGIIRMLKESGAEYTGEIEPSCDFMIVIGGDGTLLRDQWKADCPVLGINPGESIGFYMAANDKDYRKKLGLLLHGKKGRDFFIHPLSRLRTELNGRKLPQPALNDVLVSPIYVRRILESRLSAKGKKSIERNSGIIVYTPTGSHAFAHSAGAKTMRYGSPGFGVAGIAPYSGSLKRGEMLIRKGSVEIECLSDSGEVCVDGSEVILKQIKKGDVVRVQKSPKPLMLVGFSKRFD